MTFLVTGEEGCPCGSLYDEQFADLPAFAAIFSARDAIRDRLSAIRDECFQGLYARTAGADDVVDVEASTRIVLRASWFASKGPDT